MFFSQFPTVAYDFNRTGTVDQMVNIFRAIRPETLQELDAVTSYKKFQIVDGMRPDVLSQNLYGTPDYYWTFFIINDFLHDGMQVWPMSEVVLQRYIEANYSGKALCFKPDVVEDSDGIPQGTKNSVAGVLQLGELIYGATSGSIGRLVRKDADLNEIIVQDVVPGIAGTNPFSGAVDNSVVGGDFRPGEYLSASETTLDSQTLYSLQIHKCYDYSQAPSYYYISGDSEKRPITNSDGIPTLSNVYSDAQWDSEIQKNIPGYNINTFGNNDSSVVSNAIYESPLVYSGGYNSLYSENLREGYENDDDIGGTITYATNEQHLRNLNDQRSSIKIIDPAYIVSFIEEFENVLNG